MSKTWAHLKPYAFKKGQVSTFKGCHHNAESKKKLSIARMGKSPSTKGFTKETHPGLAERGRKLSLARKGKSVLERSGSEVSAKMKAMWSEIGKKRAGQSRPDLAARNRDPEFTKIRLARSRRTPNKAETQLIHLIGKYQLPFIYTGNRAVAGLLRPDFIHCNPDKKLAIEFFGRFFHDKSINPKVREEQTLERRIAALQGYGFRVLVIWDKELKDMDSMASRIKTFALIGGD